MSNIFIAFGFISFVMFLYAVYSQAQQIKALKKTVRRQRHLLEFASAQPAQEPYNVEKYLDEDWAEFEKIFRQNPTRVLGFRRISRAYNETYRPKGTIMLISRLVENLVKSVIYCVGIYAIVKWVLSRYKISKQDFTNPTTIDHSL